MGDDCIEGVGGEPTPPPPFASLSLSSLTRPAARPPWTAASSGWRAGPGGRRASGGERRMSFSSQRGQVGTARALPSFLSPSPPPLPLSHLLQKRGSDGLHAVHGHGHDGRPLRRGGRMFFIGLVGASHRWGPTQTSFLNQAPHPAPPPAKRALCIEIACRRETRGGETRARGVGTRGHTNPHARALAPPSTRPRPPPATACVAPSRSPPPFPYLIHHPGRRPKPSHRGRRRRQQRAAPHDSGRAGRGERCGARVHRLDAGAGWVERASLSTQPKKGREAEGGGGIEQKGVESVFFISSLSPPPRSPFSAPPRARAARRDEEREKYAPSPVS